MRFTTEWRPESAAVSRTKTAGSVLLHPVAERLRRHVVAFGEGCLALVLVVDELLAQGTTLVVAELLMAALHRSRADQLD